MPEPQTRWMIIRTFGFCAKSNSDIALLGIDYAKSYIQEKKGICLSGSAELYLGDVGELSNKIAEQVLPTLLDALDNPEANEVDWILEAFIKMFYNLTTDDKTVVVNYAKNYLDAPKKSTIKRVEKLIKMNK